MLKNLTRLTAVFIFGSIEGLMSCADLTTDAKICSDSFSKTYTQYKKRSEGSNEDPTYPNDQLSALTPLKANFEKAIQLTHYASHIQSKIADLENHGDCYSPTLKQGIKIADDPHLAKSKLYAEKLLKKFNPVCAYANYRETLFNAVGIQFQTQFQTQFHHEPNISQYFDYAAFQVKGLRPSIAEVHSKIIDYLNSITTLNVSEIDEVCPNCGASHQKNLVKDFIANLTVMMERNGDQADFADSYVAGYAENNVNPNSPIMRFVSRMNHLWGFDTPTPPS